MKAFILRQTGGAEQLKLEELAKPAIQPGEVLVKAQAIAINPIDVFVRKDSNALKAFLQPADGQDTFILGWDLAGIIEEVGADVKDFKKGDAVFGMVNFRGAGNVYAEYVAAPADQLALKPEHTSFEEAAAACLAALTAWQALVTHANLQQGQKILIHAAAGGVGHYAVQIAKHLGAHVIGTGSAANKDFILSLGADEYIDYKQQQFEQLVNDADVVLDPIYGDHLLRSIDATKKGGRIISLLMDFTGAIGEKAKAKDIKGYHMGVSSNGKDMRQIASLMATGALRSHINTSYSFTDLPKAHQQQEAGNSHGKIVVKL
ncbi:NADP-dependent oxidoreductase [Chitinophaga agrisoli]|uniref:NADP-dependent oxidoreductase n=1 Tax=Chitinophaga agrisoli TaxID=2607653 RepID=A0A5B2VN30_9BACT|nr:NADP-dependent oxidoreductase [Chitinophaga agrisoli]KAA2239826.1 NADP-dependent oxidoreductase [Chitinophaga agrisoli]